MHFSVALRRLIATKLTYCNETDETKTKNSWILRFSIWMFPDPETSKAKILTSRGMTLDAKMFNLIVFGCPKLQIEFFYFRGHRLGRLDAKSFDLDDLRMFKFPIWIFFNPKISKLKILTSRGMTPGC